MEHGFQCCRFQIFMACISSEVELCDSSCGEKRLQESPEKVGANLRSQIVISSFRKLSR
jgi:hypothetical protein